MEIATREAVYKAALIQIVSRFRSTCTPDPLEIVKIAEAALHATEEVTNGK